MIDAVEELELVDAAERLLGRPVRSARALGGGLLNHVARVRMDADETVVVKRSPPYVASRPEIPLDPSRSAFEAAALQWLQTRPDRSVRTPRLIASEPGTLVMEDLGALVQLDAWLGAGGDPGVLDTLARYLRSLHEDLAAPPLHNLSVQQTRLQVQYAPVQGWLLVAGVADHERLGDRVAELGTRLLERGSCFVMGDLWPPSILLDDFGEIALIDWEFCTTGHRCQDLGHLMAHLWLGALEGRHAAGLGGRFLGAYGGLHPDDQRDTATHFAAELLVRTHGTFQPDPPHPEAVRAAALAAAVAALRSDWLPGG